MEKIRNSSFLKVACYIIIPILVAILGLSIFHLVFLSEFGNNKEEKQYWQTEEFANEYLSYFIRKVGEYENQEEMESQIELQDAQGNLYYYVANQSIYELNNSIGSYIGYIMIDRQTREKIYKYEK